MLFYPLISSKRPILKLSAGKLTHLHKKHASKMMFEDQQKSLFLTGPQGMLNLAEAAVAYGELCYKPATKTVFAEIALPYPIGIQGPYGVATHAIFVFDEK